MSPPKSTTGRCRSQTVQTLRPGFPTPVLGTPGRNCDWFASTTRPKIYASRVSRRVSPARDLRGAAGCEPLFQYLELRHSEQPLDNGRRGRARTCGLGRVTAAL